MSNPYQRDNQRTCEEDEEESEAVKEDELKEQDDAKEPDDEKHDNDDYNHGDHDHDHDATLDFVEEEGSTSLFKKPFAVALQTIVHEEVEHGVGVDCKEA